MNFQGTDEDFGQYRDSDVPKGGIPFIYLCATMWHETEDEMIQMIKSICRYENIITNNYSLIKLNKFLFLRLYTHLD